VKTEDMLQRAGEVKMAERGERIKFSQEKRSHFGVEILRETVIIA